MVGGAMEWDDNGLDLESRQRREVFARFGLVMYQIQCVEKQMGILLAGPFNPSFLRTNANARDRAFDEELGKTFGRLIKKIESSEQTDQSLIPHLEEARKIRNRVVHNYFWEKSGELLSPVCREQLIEELTDIAQYFDELDSRLTVFSDTWGHQLGLTDGFLQASLEQLVLNAENSSSVSEIGQDQ